jgi:WD40 repeat protein
VGICAQALRAGAWQGTLAIVEDRGGSPPIEPYCGIRPFGYTDHSIFFARDEEKRKLGELVTTYRGVLLYGDSGVGKSSLINAGLLPIALNARRACERLRVEPREGEEIVLERIEATKEGLLGSVLAPQDESAPRVVFSVEVFEQQVRAACEHHPLLLVFDHFEDIVALFEKAEAEDANRRIVKMLIRLLREESLPVKLLFVFREDYLGSIKELLAACPDLIDNSLRLSPPKPAELQRIIRGPFERYPGHFTPELSMSLAEQLRAALGERFGAGDMSLSEVQTVCLRLWQSERPEWLLKTKHPQGILEDYLDEELDALTPAMKDVAIALLSQMVTSGGTRNVISAQDLIRGIPDQEGISSKLIEETLHQLDQKSRLVHCERRRELRLYELTSEFLLPLIRERSEQLHRQREHRREQRRRRVLWRIAVGAVLLSALLAVVTVWVLAQRNAARHEATISRREAASVTSLALLSVAQEQLEHRPDASLLLALDAYQISPRGEARNLLVTALQDARSSGTTGILHGDVTALASLAFSPNGELLASGANEGTVRLWDVKSHQQLAQVSAGPLPAKTVAFSPDGRSFAAGDENGTISLWDSATHEQLSAPIHVHDRVLSIAFSPGGQMLATGELKGLVRIWSITTRKELGAPITVHAPVGSVAFSPNGRILASGNYDRTVQMWSIRTHKQVGHSLKTSLATVTEVAFSPHGNTFATLTTELFGHGRVQLWNVATGEQLGRSIGVGNEISGFAFSPDGRTLACGGRGGTTLWSVATGREIRQSLRSSAHIATVALSPDGKILASGGEDDLIKFSSTAPVRQLEVLGRRGSGHAEAKLLTFGSDGHTLVTVGEDGRVYHWNLARHTLLGPMLDTSPAVAHCRMLSPDGGILASDDGAGVIRLWDLADGRQLGRLPNSFTLSESSEVEPDGGCGERLAFNPSGQMLAAITGENYDEVLLWSVATSRLVGRLSAVGESIRRIAFSSDGRTLVAVDSSRKSGQSGAGIQLWNVASRTRLGRVLAIDRDVGQIVLSSDRHTLAFVNITSEPAEVGKVLLWDIATRKQLGQLPLGRGESVSSIELSPDGRTLVSVSGEGGGSEELGGEVRLWDLATGKPLGLPLTAGGEAVQSVVFSPSGSALAFLSERGAIKLWRGILWRDLPELRNEVCGLVGSGLTETEWSGYVPGIRYKAVC